MTRNCLAHRTARIFAFAFLFAQTCLAQQKISGREKLLLDSVNRERTTRGLPPVKWDEGLARAARKHAKLMADQDLLEHQMPGEGGLATRARKEGANFSHITENIGMGASAEQLHDGWMHSPGHRANILDLAADSIGIAVVEGDAELYAVEDFARAVEILSIEEQEKRVGETIVARGLKLINIGTDARKSCELDRDYVGNNNAKYVAHYETPKISELPGSVEKEIRSRRFKSAAVGACPQKGAFEFTRFRIVVLFY